MGDRTAVCDTALYARYALSVGGSRARNLDHVETSIMCPCLVVIVGEPVLPSRKVLRCTRTE